MAVKTITIDMEAYDRLKRAKREGESFSQTIKRITPKPFDYEAWLKSFGKDPAGPDFIEAVERQVAQRRAPWNTGNRSRRGTKPGRAGG